MDVVVVEANGNIVIGKINSVCSFYTFFFLPLSNLLLIIVEDSFVNVDQKSQIGCIIFQSYPDSR